MVPLWRQCKPSLWRQAVRAVEALNGTDLDGRAILVREDREDKDVKNYNRCAPGCIPKTF